MAALFPPWTNTAIRLALAGIALTIVGVPTLLMIYVRTPYVTNQGVAREQPVEFDHRHHVEDDGIDCLYCHDTAARSANAGVPAANVCMGCHAQIYPESPLLQPVRRAYFDGEPLVWKRIHGVADFAFFDHSIHVSRGVACADCHGRVDRMARVRQVAPLTMKWCVDCHRSRAAGPRMLTDCSRCHR